MPTYRYQCRQCHRIISVFQSMREDPLETCEACGGKLIRLLTPGGGFILKGEGFYVNDYKRKPSSSPAEKMAEKGGKQKADSSDCSDCQT